MPVKNYTTKVNIEKYLLKTIDVSHDATITRWITAMSLAMDAHTKRPLHDTEVSTIAYDGDGTDLMIIRDCNTITSVSVDGTEMITQIAQYPTTKPYTSRIALKDGYKFTKGMQNVVVNAKQAMSSGTTPDADIVTACTILVGMMVRNQILGEDAGVTEKIGDFSITYPHAYKGDMNTALMLLSGYKRIAL